MTESTTNLKSDRGIFIDNVIVRDGNSPIDIAKSKLTHPTLFRLEREEKVYDSRRDYDFSKRCAILWILLSKSNILFYILIVL